MRWCAKPVDDFLRVAPVAHLLAITQPFLADVLRRWPFLAGVGL
jgi:hypothetical protein